MAEFPFAIVYVLSLLGLLLLNRREFKRCPEKVERFHALPIGYKFAFWSIVMPFFAGIIFAGALLIPATIAFMLLEGLSVRWYRMAGLLSLPACLTSSQARTRCHRMPLCGAGNVPGSASAGHLKQCNSQHVFIFMDFYEK